MYDCLMLPCVRPTLSAALASIALGSERVNGTVPVRRHHVSRMNHWRMILLIIEHLKLGGRLVATSLGCGETVLVWERSESVRQHCKVRPALRPLSQPMVPRHRPLPPPARALPRSDLLCSILPASNSRHLINALT
jgi:hypothetical protein